jgi:hypothetical protein
MMIAPHSILNSSTAGCPDAEGRDLKVCLILGVRSRARVVAETATQLDRLGKTLGKMGGDIGRRESIEAQLHPERGRCLEAVLLLASKISREGPPKKTRALPIPSSSDVALPESGARKARPADAETLPVKRYLFQPYSANASSIPIVPP